MQAKTARTEWQDSPYAESQGRAGLISRPTKSYEQAIVEGLRRKVNTLALLLYPSGLASRMCRSQ